MQQGLGALASTGFTSPPNGDTVGYWQQRAAYTITATLDESAQRVRATGTLRYVNNSPDTLREMYFHQYLNAFRPASLWSRVDTREGRVRFQNLREPDYGYERFTAPVRVNGVPVPVEYPGAPDSTVARIRLPAPLAPHDSLVVAFAWDARPSTVPRRQGRRGRHWDLAQWYPKVAVYDRGGWQFNALQPAGEFYGEFGTYDVTLILQRDQVVGATGVPVSGDPGWTGALRAGTSRSASGAYGAVAPANVAVPDGFKAVRFLARDVHHFAWSTSPEYRYEGAIYTRPAPRSRFRVWDTVSVHVLYRPGDDSTWGGGRVGQRTNNALQWLETVYGPYAYPQMTVLHRLDGGGTEFPMMQMNGSPSQGLILHEGGHVWTYGILADNEWRSGWMDEGLTSYQTSWAQSLTPQERLRRGTTDPPTPQPRGYRARGLRVTVPTVERMPLTQAATDIEGNAEPIGTVAQDFRDFSTYNNMIYTRAELMYGQLRDAIGDSAFVAFLRDYYARWALRHVDERAMRASAERASGKDLGWFFEQWVHRVGLTDYALRSARWSRSPDGSWVTLAEVRRRGAYRHPIAVGVRTSSGWTTGRLTKEPYDGETVRIVTAQEPVEVRLDPHHFSWDWDRRNDVVRRGWSKQKWNVDWPFLTQADREAEVFLLAPAVWYSEPGGVAAGLRARQSYLGLIDRVDVGAAFSTHPDDALPNSQRRNLWFRLENPTWGRRPLMGLRLRGAYMDGIPKADVGWRREVASSRGVKGFDATATFSDATGSDALPELWEPVRAGDLSLRAIWQRGRASRDNWYVEPRALLGGADEFYAKGELAFGATQVISDNARLSVRAYAGVATDSIPGQRALFVSSADPIATFENSWWRPRGALLKRPGFHWLPPGAAALRGFDAFLATNWAAGGNIDGSRRIVRVPGVTGLAFWGHVFADAAYTDIDDGLGLADAGVGLSIRGRLYDRDIVLRIDSPFFVNRPALAIDRRRGGTEEVAARWVLSFSDYW